jgi:hypothetical protein
MATTTVNYDSITDTNALTLTTASLAASSTHTVGRQSTVVNNTSTEYLDFIVTGLFETAGTITAGTLLVYVFTPTDVTSSTFSYPFATATELGETDAARTFTAEQRNKLALADVIPMDTTAGRQYAVRPFSVAMILGLPVAPLKWGIWITHDLGSGTLSATEADCFVHWTGIKLDSA